MTEGKATQDKKKNNLDSAKKMAATLGFDIEKLSNELATEVADKAMAKLQMPDAESIAYKVLELLKDKLPQFNPDEAVRTIEAKLAGKITETLQIINEKLSNNLDERIKQIFDELNTIKTTIPAIIEQREQALREEIAAGLKEFGGQSSIGKSLSFLDNISPDVKGKLLDKAIDRLLGSPQSNVNELIQSKIEGILLGQKLRVGTAGIDDIARIFPGGQTQQPTR